MVIKVHGIIIFDRRIPNYTYEGVYYINTSQIVYFYNSSEFDLDRFEKEIGKKIPHVTGESTFIQFCGDGLHITVAENFDYIKKCIEQTK